MSIVTLKKSVPFTVTLAVLSAGWLITTSAHAGLLGGGSGALGGAFTPRSLDIGGSAAGQVQRDPMTLPRGDKAKGAVGNAVVQGTGKVNDTAGQSAAKAIDAKATVGGDAAAARQTGSDGASTAQHRLQGLGAQAQGMGAAGASVSRQAADKPANNAPAAVPTTTPTDTTAAKPMTSSGAQGGAGVATRRGEASAAGSAHASRSDRGISADGSANASMQR